MTSELGWKAILFYLLYQLQGKLDHYSLIILMTVVITSGFIQIGYILGQAALDKYVNAAIEILDKDVKSEKDENVETTRSAAKRSQQHNQYPNAFFCFLDNTTYATPQTRLNNVSKLRVSRFCWLHPMDGRGGGFAREPFLGCSEDGCCLLVSVPPLPCCFFAANHRSLSFSVAGQQRFRGPRVSTLQRTRLHHVGRRRFRSRVCAARRRWPSLFRGRPIGASQSSDGCAVAIKPAKWL